MAFPTLALPHIPPPPISQATQRVAHCDWSMLPLDLMQLIFERLGFSDFERAKLVCSSWHLGTKQSRGPNNMIPWMILFPVGKNYCLLSNPEDKEKLYKTQHLGDDFSDSFCLTTYKSWLLMLTNYKKKYSRRITASCGVYILNILTGERMDLPAVQSYEKLYFPRLWIDEKIKDYLVIGMELERCGRYKKSRGTLVSFKKGDNSWKQITEVHLSSEIDPNFSMVYKDHKLYCIDYLDLLIFDFSGEYPLQVFKINIYKFLYKYPSRYDRRPRRRLDEPEVPIEYHSYSWKYNAVVTVRGDVLFVVSHRPARSPTWTFKIYKTMMMMMDSSEWEEIVSLGDESILLDLGVTVLAKDLEGITSNSIYFTDCRYNIDEYVENKIFIYNLDTKKVEYPVDRKKKKRKKFEYPKPSVSFSHAHWFLPTFKPE